MTDKTKQIEEAFNKDLPKIKQGELGAVKAVKFNRERFLKSAKELQEIIQANDQQESLKPAHATKH
jgi:hypothetical protein